MLFKNSVRTSKRTPHFTITEINWLTLSKEIIAVYSENLTKYRDTMLTQVGHIITTRLQPVNTAPTQLLHSPLSPCSAPEGRPAGDGGGPPTVCADGARLDAQTSLPLRRLASPLHHGPRWMLQQDRSSTPHSTVPVLIQSGGITQSLSVLNTYRVHWLASPVQVFTSHHQTSVTFQTSIYHHLSSPD
jgi:hypothetical protein